MGVMRDFRRSNLVAYVLAPAARTLKRWCVVLSLHPIWPKAATKLAGPVLQRSRRRSSTRYSIVVACYNVDKYIDDFFAIDLQPTRRLEVPGSHRCRRWLDRRYRFAYRLLAATLSRVDTLFPSV